ncbi:ribonuclease H-like domain-containing protein [Methanobrevibacter filiformis]|uniref:DNA polymerase family B, exonuclease domain n=1 Tax=Methanobrevibacter filiformis TaxID=55758 RepID=A0A166BZF2_9EURY|nr:ribonuclease H-like domain-containing protein [Methanobrevibacter filiformis]KZX10047.1 DNA polymerase family B, exonuclease domain [Methanobrevibacter filiformis]
MPSKKHQEHQKELLKTLLSRSLSSENPSKETIAKADANSTSYVKDLKTRLLNKYEGKTLEDIEKSEIIENSYGETLQIKEKEKMDFSLKSNDIKKEILCDLTLVPRIGDATEKRLKNEGYDSVESLLKHERFADPAKETLDKIESGSFKDLFYLVKNNSNAQNNLLKCASHIEHGDFKFMDIETLGLSNVPIILIGIAEIQGKYIESTQYLLREKVEEPAVIQGFMDHLDENSVYVTYNGASFDVPFIKNRMNHHRMEYEHNLINYDLMYFARRLWRDKLPNCKLTTIEKHLFDIERVDDVPGSQIPGYYETYLKEQNIGPLIPIIEHNRMDIVSLASFMMKMAEEC